MLSLISLILIVPSALALPSFVQTRSPPKSISISTKLNPDSASNLIEVDRARARKFMEAAKNARDGGTISVPIANAVIIYLASVGVGNPPTKYNLGVDTGSSNTWVGATTPYHPTATSKKTKDNFNITYGSGSVFGKEYIDQVTLAPDLVIQRQSIGVATNSTGFSGLDGLLGLGPVDITKGTLHPDRTATVPTVTDNLYEQGKLALISSHTSHVLTIYPGTISRNEVGISFEPGGNRTVTNGELTFGGIDPAKLTGEISYVHCTNTFPSSLFWGINQTLRYGDSVEILPNSAGIVDTGTTLLLLATDAFKVYQRETGSVMDAATGLLRITPAQFSKLKSLFFKIGRTTFEVTPNAQAWPRSLNGVLGGDSRHIYLIVGDLGTPSGEGLDFINGFAFLERFYSVFDTKQKRVGLAATQFTHAIIN